MKKINNILILFLAIISISSFKINAQQTDENTLVINKYFQNIGSEQSLLVGANSLEQAQINYNALNNAELSILQSGNYNFINVNTNQNNLSVNQTGNYNNYEFISYYSRNDLNFEVQQIGNNNLIQVIGENSLINNMKIVQKSDYKVITITNH